MMCLKIHHQEWVNIANTLFRFLYQVFPGTSAHCKRQLLRAARIGELDTVQKLVGDTKTAQVLCNSARMDDPCPVSQGSCSPGDACVYNIHCNLVTLYILTLTLRMHTRYPYNYVVNNNNNTQMAAIAPGPYTMHPEHWAEPTIHVHIHEMVVSTLPCRHLNLPQSPTSPSSPDEF